MLYALNLDLETNRILSATIDKYGCDWQPRVEELPEGDISNYLYINGEYVYDPLPPEEDDYIPPEDRIAALEEQNEMLLECILEMSELLYE